MRNYLESLLQNAPATAVDQVRELAKALLPSGLCAVERIAKHMHVDYRTIQRRLEREGTSFTEILNGIRTEMSQHYLEPNNRSLSDIAYSLGFSSLSAFSRWFQTQYGCSPTKWRKGKFARM